MAFYPNFHFRTFLYGRHSAMPESFFHVPIEKRHKKTADLGQPFYRSKGD